jgi:hypothetical protein
MKFLLPPNTDLAIQNEQFIQLEQLIEAKRRMLLEKQKKLRFVSKQNKFLDVVREDYNEYHRYIIKQKEEQMKALELLNNYIKDLTRSGNLTKHNIEDAKYEQRKIVHEIKSIKKNLDEIISNTDDIHSTLQNKQII